MAIQLILALGFILLQLFVFVLKLVPLGFFFWLIQKLYIGGEDLVNMLVSGSWMTLVMIVFIIVVGYIIMMGILHMIVNINIFSNIHNAIHYKDEEQDTGKLKTSLTRDTVNQLANALMSFIKQAKGLWSDGKLAKNTSIDTSNHFLRDSQMVKDNMVLSFALFQWGLLSGREAFTRLLEKAGKWTNVVVMLIIVAIAIFILNIKQEIKLNNGETIILTNGYDYINYKMESNGLNQVAPFIGSLVAQGKNLINESITFRDKKIQTIAKIYYETTGLKWFTPVELVESDNQFNPISLSISKATTDDPSSLTKGLNNKKNSWSAILGEGDMQLFKDSRKIGVGNSIYADELASIMNNKQVDWMPTTTNMNACIKTVNASKYKNNYFIPRNIYNSTLYQNESSGTPFPSDKLSTMLGNFEKSFVKLKNGKTAVSLASANNFEAKGTFAIPWLHQNTEEALIGMYFLIGTNSNGNQYYVDTTLWNQFKKDLSKGAVLAWRDRISNIRMLKNSNHLITDFCYGFTTFQQLQSALHINKGLGVTKHRSLEFNIEVPFVEYGSFFEELFNKYLAIVNRGKHSKLSEPERIEIAYYLFNRADIRIRSGLSYATNYDAKGADALKPYFYMFKSNRLDFMVGSLFIKQALQGTEGLNAFLVRFQHYMAEDTNPDLPKLMASSTVQDIFGKYIGLDSGLKNFHFKLLDTLKKKHNLVPAGEVFKTSNIEVTKNRFFNGYRGENVATFFGDGVLARANIQNLIYSLQNEIKVANGLNISSNTLNEENAGEKIMFFGESYNAVFNGNDGQTYRKKGVMIGLIPLVESEVPFMNNLLFMIYIASYLMVLAFIIWFSGVGQLAFKYIMYKRSPNQEEWVWSEELKDLAIRFIAFVIMMRVYFILTTF